MEHALKQERSAESPRITPTEDSLVRRWAFGAGVTLLLLVVVGALAAPELISRTPLLLVWSLGACAVVVAYAVARGMRRRSAGGQSRRMRRFISSH
jgi:peptidoglycan/LPS O-acetylase OafA/YrhL